MEQLFEQFGVEWGLLAAQAINFLVLLLVLRAFAYKPIVKFLADRQERIAGGIEKASRAEEALVRAKEVEEETRLKAEKDAFMVIKQAEHRGLERESEIMTLAEKKGEHLMHLAERRIKDQYEAEKNRFYNEAKGLMTEMVNRLVEKDPKAFDDKLIAEAVMVVKLHEDKK